MTSTENTPTKAENLRLLEDVAQLVPNQGIRVGAFTRQYSDFCGSRDQQLKFDGVVEELLTWYLSSIKSLKAEIKEKDARLGEKDARLGDKDARLRDKDVLIEALRSACDDKIETVRKSLLDEIKAKDDKLNDKEATIEELCKRNAEATNMVKVLSETALIDRQPNQKWGTVTRSEAWKTLLHDKRALVFSELPGLPGLPEQQGMKAELISQLDQIDQNAWNEESAMYPDIIDAISSTIHKLTLGIFVLNTSRSGDFRPDISVGHYDDDRLLYGLRYFIELKLPKHNALSAENCGQVLDYLNKAHEKQPYRTAFVGILSNFTSAWVITAQYHREQIAVSQMAAPTLADAIVYANLYSQKHYANLPAVDKRLPSDYKIIAIAKHHVLLEVQQPTPKTLEPISMSTKPAAISTMQTRTRTTAPTGNQPWRYPTRHNRSSAFVLKIRHGNTTVHNEINILKKIRDASCLHLPELVWAPDGDEQLGIVPVGKPINFRQTASVSCKIVRGLMDGLKHLHLLDIVHRDIRPSNLVLDQNNNVVIVDYETSVTQVDNKDVHYLGGYICWPKRLLEYNITKYTPEPADDLFASILVVLHLLFPSRFDAFHASKIRVSDAGQARTSETMQLLVLWREIEQSKVWGPFVEAAKDRNYELLKNMGDVFCHI